MFLNVNKERLFKEHNTALRSSADRNQQVILFSIHCAAAAPVQDHRAPRFLSFSLYPQKAANISRGESTATGSSVRIAKSADADQNRQAQRHLK